MIKNKIVNEYGAAISPTIESLESALKPTVVFIQTWGEKGKFDAQDWAFLRCIIKCAARCEYCAWPDGINHDLAKIAHRTGERFRREYNSWLDAQIGNLSQSEISLVWEYAYDMLCGVCAQIQLEKAMQKRKEGRALGK